MFCGARYTHHTFAPVIKHLITTTANKHPGKKSFIDTEKHEKIPLASSCAYHIIENNTVNTNPHYAYVSRNIAELIPSVSKSCRLYSQYHVQSRHNFVCHSDVGLLFSLVRLVVCWDCHVTSFARSTWVVCSGDKFIVLSKLNRYEKQRSLSRSETIFIVCGLVSVLLLLVLHQCD